MIRTKKRIMYFSIFQFFFVMASEWIGGSTEETGISFQWASVNVLNFDEVDSNFAFRLSLGNRKKINETQLYFHSVSFELRRDFARYLFLVSFFFISNLTSNKLRPLIILTIYNLKFFSPKRRRPFKFENKNSD